MRSQSSQPGGKPASPSQAGFGLIELVVTIGIMVLVSSVVLSRHTGFNSEVLLRNQAYSVAFTIREAQQSAVSAVGGAGDFRSAYGVYFTTDTTNNANQLYRSYRDLNGNLAYDAPPSGDNPLLNRLDGRFVLSNIDAPGASLVPPGVPDLAAVSIAFQRPNFDAIYFDANGNEFTADQVNIEIQLQSSGETEQVVVLPTGQILVE
mgnify:CR=1 FL=1